MNTQHHQSKLLKRLWPIVASTIASLAIMWAPAAPPDEDQELSEVWSIARGGQIYDKWMTVLGRTTPEETHPAYPAAGGKQGGDTWRCKECHGWDYRGAKGAYGKGSHFSGIKGIRDMVGIDPKVIAKIISDETHRYTLDMIPAMDLEKLALFVSLGQIDMDLYVNRATKKARGNPNRGATYYQTICAVCHGFDGKALNFGKVDDPEYVGTIAHENPWEFLHKVRFGQPGIPMISLIALPVQDVADILAYAQTLPVK